MIEVASDRSIGFRFPACERDFAANYFLRWAQQDGAKWSTAGIRLYFEDRTSRPNADIGPKGMV